MIYACKGQTGLALDPRLLSNLNGPDSNLIVLPWPAQPTLWHWQNRMTWSAELADLKLTWTITLTLSDLVGLL